MSSTQLTEPRQAHQETVTWIKQLDADLNSPDACAYVSGSYGGEVKSWTSQWRQLAAGESGISGIMHGDALRLSSLDSLVALCSERGGKLIVLVQRGQSFEPLERALVPEEELGKGASYSYACWGPSEEGSARLITVVEAPATKTFEIRTAEVTAQGMRFVERSGPWSWSSGSGLHVHAVSPSRNAFAVAVARHVWVFDSRRLQLLSEFEAKPGSGLLKALAITDDLCCWLPCESGHVEAWRPQKPATERTVAQAVLEKRLRLDAGGAFSVFYLGLGRDAHLYVATESSLLVLPHSHSSDVPFKEKIAAGPLHAVANCGLEFGLAKEGGRVVEYIASGDLAGQVFVWRVQSTEKLPVARGSVGASVRCCAWQGGEAERLAVGTLEGEVWLWDHLLAGGVPEQVLRVEGGVTCLRWHPVAPFRLLAVATTAGHLHVFSHAADAKEKAARLQLVWTVNAHVPKEGSDNFGSLGLYAEIWSCCWSPKGDRIATCSEDQTTVIWSSEGTRLATLRGHTLAVTCVDWRHTALGELLVTCADDKQLHVWQESAVVLEGASDPDGSGTWELRAALSTAEVPEWHTVTYCQLEQDGDRVVACTQNGYLFLWNLRTSKKITAIKVHMGSVEGLRWSPASKLIATTSSDCTINVYSVCESKTTSQSYWHNM